MNLADGQRLDWDLRVLCRVILAVAAMLLPACAEKAPAEIAGEVDAYLAAVGSPQPFNGAVLIARKGEVILSKGYGSADRERQIPNTPQTRYRIHWLTMPFTALAVMQLQAEGKLAVEDLVCEHIPDCPADWQGITLHHLLTHTSGVADEVRPWQGEAERPATGLDRVELIKHTDPYFPPGDRLRYSANGYIILGAIIEHVSGLPYDEYLQAHIFNPLGMENSGYEGTGLAVGYGPSGAEAPAPDLLFRYSAGGLYSTVEDLYLWDQALYGEELLPQAYLEKMFMGYAETPSVDFKGADYGYGWFIGRTLDRPVIFHGGGMSGYTSGILRFPDEKITIIVLRNDEVQVYDRLEIELARIVFGQN